MFFGETYWISLFTFQSQMLRADLHSIGHDHQQWTLNLPTHEGDLLPCSTSSAIKSGSIEKSPHDTGFMFRPTIYNHLSKSTTLATTPE